MSKPSVLNMLWDKNHFPTMPRIDKININEDNLT